MKRRAVLPVIAVFLLLGNLAVTTADAARPGGVTVGPDVGAQGEDEGEEGEAEARPAGADQFITAQRLYPYTRPLSLDAAYRAAQDQATRAREQATRATAAAAWQPLGPSNVGGRIT